MADRRPPGAIHAAAAVGYQAGASEYEAGRPSYAPEAVDLLAGLGALGPGRRALDVGAGTGKWTALLLPSGSTVIAVEPVEAMRALLRAKLPSVPVLAGTAETLPVGSGWADLVTVATALHWFELDRALPELVRVTRPGGLVAIVRNQRDLNTGWVAELEALLAPHRGDVPVARHARWQEEVARHEELTDVADATFDNPHPMDRATLVARVASLSYVASMAVDQRTRLLTEVDRLADSLPARFTMPTTTQLRVLRTTIPTPQKETP